MQALNPPLIFSEASSTGWMNEAASHLLVSLTHWLAEVTYFEWRLCIKWPKGNSQETMQGYVLKEWPIQSTYFPNGPFLGILQILHLNKMQKSDGWFVDKCNKRKVSEPSILQIHKCILDLERKWITWSYLSVRNHMRFLCPHNSKCSRNTIDWHKEDWIPFPDTWWLCTVS